MSSEEREYSKVQWFIMVILIPIIFAIILFSVLLSFMGVNVVDKAKEVASNVPFLSEYVKTDEQLAEEEEQANIEELTAMANQREVEIERLKQSISVKEDEVLELKAEIQRLMAQLEEKDDAKLEIITEYEDIAKLYEAMSAKNAANILSELPEQEAAVHLSFVKADVKASILSKMTPEKAAQLISLATNN